MDDVKIIELYWSRSENAIAETSARYEHYCYTIAYNILYSKEDSEECVNDTWLRAWNVMPPQKPNCLSAFLGRITRNLSLDRLKERFANRRGGGRVSEAVEEMEDCLPDNNNVEKEVDDKELAALIDSFLEDLGAQERQIFVRRYWYLSSVGEIAADYGFGVSRVKTSLMRTRAKFRERLTEEGITI